jgi:hypothetical protein
MDAISTRPRPRKLSSALTAKRDDAHPAAAVRPLPGPWTGGAGKVAKRCPGGTRRKIVDREVDRDHAGKRLLCGGGTFLLMEVSRAMLPRVHDVAGRFHYPTHGRSKLEKNGSYSPRSR